MLMNKNVKSNDAEFNKAGLLSGAKTTIIRCWNCSQVSNQVEFAKHDVSLTKDTVNIF